MIVAGYSIDLYCDGTRCTNPWDMSKGTFAGQSYAACARKAKSQGWYLNSARTKAICPRCQPKAPTAEQECVACKANLHSKNGILAHTCKAKG